MRSPEYESASCCIDEAVWAVSCLARFMQWWFANSFEKEVARCSINTWTSPVVPCVVRRGSSVLVLYVKLNPLLDTRLVRLTSLVLQ